MDATGIIDSHKYDFSVLCMSMYSTVYRLIFYKYNFLCMYIRIYWFPVCDDCDKSYHGDCPVHGPLIPLDESQGCDQDSKSFTSVPVPLQVTMSSIMNAGKEVFAKEFIPRTRIGPYKGEVVQKEDVTDETDTSYFWEVGVWLTVLLCKNSLFSR